MKAKIAYGNQYLEIAIPDNKLNAVLHSPDYQITAGNEEIIRNALGNPLETSLLPELIKKKNAHNAVIVVNDITRPTPYQSILPPLLKEIETGGIKSDNITLIVATGIHRPNTEEENLSIFGADICRRYKIENHNCDTNLTSLGYLSNGMELIINKTVAEAELLITTGLVGLHYFAGYSGGRKSILPGVAARKLIEANHRMMSDSRACLGNYHDNPVNDIMLEAAHQAKVDFTINVVTASKNTIAFAAAGNIYEAWIKAVKYCEASSVVAIKEKADIVIAGCGGYPKDINMYQAQKALDAAVLAVKDGGIIILAAECSEGLGEETFSTWINEATCPQDINERFLSHFELGGHKAYAICRILEKAEIMLYSSLNDETVKKMYMTPVHDIEAAIKMALDKQGDNASILLLPEAPKLGIKINPQV
ncbi:MAG: nickel-dependent lactate racemase [Syntrophomonadaceae bacterium]|nr:nickel-dependent lactate racemase [Syntrophomonadaceae bacterium]MDD3023711.1 nickel-dependent lactate racemase [Syntrophomonadaceae bacterium]